MNKKKLLQLTLAEIGRLEKSLFRTQQQSEWYKDKYETLQATTVNTESSTAESEISSLSNQIEGLKEDLECVHLYLDDKGAPRADKSGEVYSIVGRIMELVDITKERVVNYDWSQYNTEPTRLIAELQEQVLALEGENRRHVELNKKLQSRIDDMTTDDVKYKVSCS